MKNLFSGLFGWRNGGVSKWKRLIKSIQVRVKILNNKRESIIRRSTKDVVQLLMNSEHQRALVRVDLLSKDQSIAAAYNLVDQFCVLVLDNLPYILHYKDYPNDINEALSSLLFASARCGDLPELMELRKLFRRHYGENFVRGAVELLPGNLVNPQMIEKLSVKSISHDVKFRLMKQIAIDNGLELGPPDIDCKLELQQDKVSNFNYDVEDNCCLESPCYVVTSEERDDSDCPTPRSSVSQPQTPKIRREVVYKKKVESCASSCESSSPCSHIHPKLPDCDELATMFKAFKEEYIQSVIESSDKVSNFNYDVEDNCCLESPCYVVTSEERDDSDCSTPRSSVSQPHTPKIRREVVYKKEVESCASSCESSSPCRHIHPKLPDCDELATMFKVFKEEYIQSVIEEFSKEFVCN